MGDVRLRKGPSRVTWLVALLIGTAIATSLLRVEPPPPRRVEPAPEPETSPAVMIRPTDGEVADGAGELIGCPKIELSLRVGTHGIWIGATLGNRYFIQADEAGHDWAAVGRLLDEFHAQPWAADREDIEVAADDTVPVEALMQAIALARAHGFSAVEVGEPRLLSAAFGQYGGARDWRPR